ncbi:MAG TPA: CAP domain-containing protein [Pseudolabrys sp.]
MVRILILFLGLVACCMPARAETLNSFRHAHALPALHRSGALQAMAQRHARSMAARHSMDHADFYAEHGRAGARAENVAAGCATESCAIAIWAGSSGHRQNMLLSDVRNYGLASAAGGGSRYWCLVLGR